MIIDHLRLILLITLRIHYTFYVQHFFLTKLITMYYILSTYYIL